MDKKEGFFSDLTGQRNSSVLCFRASLSTSSGLWLKERPLDFPFPLLLAQLSIIFLFCHLSHALLRPFGLPQVISHTIAGIVMGPSCLSRYRLFQETVFPLRSWVHLDLVAQLAFVLFIFVIGVETDLGYIRRSSRRSLCIALFGTAVPYISVIGFAILHPGIVSDPSYGTMVTRMARRWSVTSNTVVACLLAEFNLLTSKLGRLAMSASLTAECIVVALSAVFNIIVYSASLFQTLIVLCCFAAFGGFVWAVARPFAVWTVSRTPEGAALDDGFFIFVILLALGCSIAGELVGETLMSGPLFFGLLLPSGPPLGTALVDRFLAVGSQVFLPVFFAVAGLRTNLGDLRLGHTEWVRTAYLAASGATGKIVAVTLCCLYSGMPPRDAVVLALILSSHGIVDIFSFNNWEDFKQADSEIYAINILALVLIGGAAGALVNALYSRASCRAAAARKPRTVQELGYLDELRVLACVHGEDAVPSLLAVVGLLCGSATTPLCVYLLHLSPLSGQSNATLVPYKPTTIRRRRPMAAFKPPSHGSASDRVVNSFRELEKRHPPGRLAVLPFVGVSPYAAMHDDICSLAADKLANLILLPFHRRADSSSLHQNSVNPAVRTVNSNVLAHASCASAVLVNRGAKLRAFSAVTVFFIGGCHDREALAIAARMADNSTVERLEVVRFRVEEGSGDEEDEMDDAAMRKFVESREGDERLRYREDVVTEGPEILAVVRDKSKESGLILVGRGGRTLTRLTSGLEMWSEFRELGVIGDMLASPDLGANAAVLVVQHPLAASAEQNVTAEAQGGSVKSVKGSPKEEPRGSDVEYGHEGKKHLIQGEEG